MQTLPFFSHFTFFLSLSLFDQRSVVSVFKVDDIIVDDLSLPEETLT